MKRIVKLLSDQETRPDTKGVFSEFVSALAGLFPALVGFCIAVILFQVLPEWGAQYLTLGNIARIFVIGSLAFAFCHADLVERVSRIYLDIFLRLASAVSIVLYLALGALALVVAVAAPKESAGFAGLTAIAWAAALLATGTKNDGATMDIFSRRSTWDRRFYALFAVVFLALFVIVTTLVTRFGLNGQMIWILPLALSAFVLATVVFFSDIPSRAETKFKEVFHARNLARHGLGWLTKLKNLQAWSTIAFGIAMIWVIGGHLQEYREIWDKSRINSIQASFSDKASELVRSLDTASPVSPEPIGSAISGTGQQDSPEIIEHMPEQASGSTATGEISQASGTTITKDEAAIRSDSDPPNSSEPAIKKNPEPTVEIPDKPVIVRVGDRYKFPRLLGLGNTGSDVRSLQELLKKAGTYSGALNGVYDEATGIALEAFIRKSTGFAGMTQLGPKARERLLRIPLPTSSD